MSVILTPLHSGPLTPSTTEEYLALQLAKRLGDEARLASYLAYAEHHPAIHLAKLFHHAKGEPDSANVFHSSLTQPSP